MKLSDLKEIWGIPIVKLKEYCKRYKFYNILLIVGDIIAVCLLTLVMYKQKNDFVTYILVMLLFCLLFNFIYNTVLNPQKWQVYKFFLSNKNCKVQKKKYKVNDKNMFSIMYCTGYRRVVPNKEVKDYMEWLISACNEDNYYAKKVMKYLSKYEDESGNLIAYIMVKGNKQYFLNFIEEGEDSDGNSDTGAVEGD